MHPKAHKTSFLSKLTPNTDQLNNLYKPVIFNLSNPEDRLKVADLAEKKSYLQVFDQIATQVKELIKCRNPSIVLSETDLNIQIEKEFGDQDVEEYGVWVYYPWSEKIVHLLNEEDFITVRTNRNKHKITEAEQSILSKKIIGVMGLSVGQSVSLTLAMERGFGELRIADFDELDLSNLNRIRTGIHNIKLSKTVIVAREIAEIDPFLKVTCFNEGISSENLPAFLTENGKLDLLIDECDSFDVKILAREQAKALGIPVLMEGSDRCTIDIERFDLEPNRPVLHGYVKNVDMKMFKNLKTLDEKLPYIAPVTGIETLSPRMKASAVEIMTSISTWPQLASAVTYGGGITADISRRILLKNLKVSGRFFIDIDELVCDEPPILQDSVIKEEAQDLLNFETYIKENQLEPAIMPQGISELILQKLIDAADKAPSGGNNQPWLWHYQNNTLHLFLNKDVSGAYLDPAYISSYISLGAAVENLLIAASVNQLEVNWKFTPELLPDHVAQFSFSPKQIVSESDKQLAKQIDFRHTNRKPGIPHELNINDLNSLEQIAKEISGISLKWITDPESLKKLGKIAGEADLLRMFIPEAHEDFITKEMRWTVEETNITEDGIGIHSLDLSNNNQIGIRLMKDARAIQFLKEINGGSIFKNLASTQFQQSSAVGLLTLPTIDDIDYLTGGRAVQKLWLKATELGYQIHPVNVPIIFFYKCNFEPKNDLSQYHKEQIKEMHLRFKELFNIADNLNEIFLFRLFKAESSPIKTIRKPTYKTLTIGTTKIDN